MHNKKDVYRYPYRDSNTLEGSKRLKEREKDSKTKGKIPYISGCKVLLFT